MVKRSSYGYQILASLLLLLAVGLLLTSCFSMWMQHKQEKTPITTPHAMTEWLLSVSKKNQRHYFILGIAAGIVSGFCFGVAFYGKSPKNPK